VGYVVFGAVEKREPLAHGLANSRNGHIVA
jgi:hypothetical protein